MSLHKHPHTKWLAAKTQICECQSSTTTCKSAATRAQPLFYCTLLAYFICHNTPTSNSNSTPFASTRQVLMYVGFCFYFILTHFNVFTFNAASFCQHATPLPFVCNACVQLTQYALNLICTSLIRSVARGGRPPARPFFFRTVWRIFTTEW